MPAPKPFSYYSAQTHITYEKGKLRAKTRRVRIKNGKGFKEIVSRFGRTIRRSRKPLTKKEIGCIQKCQFIPGLFKACETCVKKMD